jgi:hypothetical protein
VSTLVYFGTATLQFLINPDGVARTTKLTLCSMFPPVALCEGMFAFVKFETSIGATWENVDLVYNGISIQDSLVCMTVGGTYLLLVGILMEVYSPKEFGQPFSLVALCKKSKNVKVDLSRERVQEGEFETRYMDEKNVEAVTQNLSAKE